MFRQIVLGGILVGAIVVGVAWASGWFRASAQVNGPADNGRANAQPAGEKADIGAPLRTTGSPASTKPVPPATENRGRSRHLIVVAPNSRLSFLDIVDVPAAREGVLSFIATEIKPGEKVAPADIIEHKIGTTTKQYRRLKEGDWVEKDQLLALVDNRLAYAEVEGKRAKQKASEADLRAALDTAKETLERFKTQERLYQQSGGNLPVTSYEEYRGALATYYRYKSEAASKEEAVTVAKAELNQAETTLGMYEVRSKFAGRVKKLYKHSGEYVKALDPTVVQIENYKRLRVEGLVDLQYKDSLQGIKEVVLEPTIRVSSYRPYVGHTRDITGVAFGKDANDPTLVSSGDDGTIRVWKLSQDQEVLIFKNLGGAVRAVACTPPGADSGLKPANLCLSGDAAGKVRLWDLDGKEDTNVPLREMKDRHQRAVRCVAFSADGAVCASGGEDHEVMVWDTASGDRLHQLTGHRDTVTALHFYETKDKGLHLVSVSDDVVQDWTLGTKGAEHGTPHYRRTSQVAELGVSADGSLLMDEQGSEMHVIKMDTSRKQYILRNASPTNNFKTVALFSPDSTLALTTSGSQDYLQLWRLGKPRTHECRQLMTGEGSAITCAAFDPRGRYVVAGLKDRKVCVWALPAEEELKEEIKATVIAVENSVESVQNQFRIIAEVDNSKGLLTAGDIVTMVAYPNK
jgi:WD40 repeat protein